jgi:hypothetical protein
MLWHGHVCMGRSRNEFGLVCHGKGLVVWDEFGLMREGHSLVALPTKCSEVHHTFLHHHVRIVVQ